MLRFEVKDTVTRQKAGTGKRSGKAYSFKEQSAYVHLAGKPYPVEVTLTLNDNDVPHAPGNYTLGPDSFYVDPFGSLAVKPRLVKA
jgi:hypothetical protein